MKRSLDDLAEELAPYKGKYQFKQILHVKSQGLYRIKDVFFKESDLSIWFSYYPEEHHGVVFQRPIHELQDDRFQIL